MAKFNQKPLHNLFGAQPPKTSRQRRREAGHREAQPATRAERIAMDPAQGPDQMVVVTFDSLSQISDQRGRPEWAHPSLVQERSGGLVTGRSVARMDIETGPLTREELNVALRRAVEDGRRRHPAEFALAYGAGPARVNRMLDQDYSSLERRIYASPPMRNYPIQAASVAMESFARAMRDAGPSMQDFQDAVRSAVMAFTAPNLAQNLPKAKNRAQTRKPDHPETGKVIRRPTRSYAGLLIEEVRQADGSVARRIQKNPSK